MKRLFALCLLMVSVTAVSARTVYITRHGQVGDKKYRDEAVGEVKLTPLGNEQAQLLAAYLKEKRSFNGTILVSPLLRTIETGAHTARLLGKTVILEPGIQELNEKSGGRGMSLAEINARFGELAVPGPAFKDGWRVKNENADARRQRISGAWARILTEQKGDLLLVGHGASVFGVVDCINKMMPAEKRCKGTVWNCCLFTVTLDEQDKPLAMTYTTEYMPDTMVTSNFGCPKIERADDPAYMTREQERQKWAAKKQKTAQDDNAHKAKAD